MLTGELSHAIAEVLECHDVPDAVICRQVYVSTEGGHSNIATVEVLGRLVASDLESEFHSRIPAESSHGPHVQHMNDLLFQSGQLLNKLRHLLARICGRMPANLERTCCGAKQYCEDMAGISKALEFPSEVVFQRVTDSLEVGTHRRNSPS